MRIGLIGTGKMAQTHAHAWRDLGPDVIVHSRRPARGAEFAAEHGFAVEADLSRMLERVDVVDVCTPTDTHAPLTRRAAEGGRHVICEKPIAGTVAEAEAMIAATQDADVCLLVGHTLRYLPPYVLARKAIGAGRIGEPRRVAFHRGGEFPPWADWFAETERSGGVLVDLAIHDIDYARWVFGDVATIDARVTTGPGGGLPYRTSAELRHHDGTVSEITASWEHPGAPFRPTFEIVGSEGALSFDSLPTPVLRDGHGKQLWADDGINPYAEQLAEFVEALGNGGDPRVTPGDALVALQIALAGVDSAAAETPRPIAVTGGVGRTRQP